MASGRARLAPAGLQRPQRPRAGTRSEPVGGRVGRVTALAPGPDVLDFSVAPDGAIWAWGSGEQVVRLAEPVPTR